MTAQIDKIARSYYGTYKKYGDLNRTFDADKITQLVCLENDILGSPGDAVATQKQVETYIQNVGYKKTASSDLVYYLIFAALVFGILLVIKRKKQ